MLRLPTKRRELAGGDDAAAIHDRHLLADVLDQLELVAREQHRCAARRLAAQHLRERLHRDRVEPGEGLVEHQQLRLVHERRRELRPLLVPVRQLLDLRSAALGQSEPVEPARGRRARVLPAHAVQAPEIRDLLGRRGIRGYNPRSSGM